MDSRRCTSLILIAVLSIAMQVMINPVTAQIPNATMAQDRNNTKLIVNLKNQTITLVDIKTNETIAVKNMTLKTAANTTTDKNNTGNLENTTITENLTSNFNAPQGK